MCAGLCACSWPEVGRSIPQVLLLPALPSPGGEQLRAATPPQRKRGLLQRSGGSWWHSLGAGEVCTEAVWFIFCLAEFSQFESQLVLMQRRAAGNSYPWWTAHARLVVAEGGSCGTLVVCWRAPISR